MAENTAARFFSSRYGQAREKFLAAANSVGTELVAFENTVKGVAGMG